MDAYATLNLRKSDFTGRNQEDIDAYVKRTANLRLNNLIIEVEKDRQYEEGEAQFDKLAESGKKILATYWAYTAVCDSKKREEYDSAGMPDVDESIEKLEKSLDSNPIFWKKNVKGGYEAITAYELLKIQGVRRNDDRKVSHDSESFMRFCSKSLRSGFGIDHLTEGVETTATLMVQAKSALSKIKTQADREKYDALASSELEYTKCMETAQKEKGSIIDLKFVSSQPTTFEISEPSESEYSSIKIANTGGILYGTEFFNKYGKKMNRYVVEKQKPDGSTVKHGIFSNIDMGRLETDVEYRKHVEALITESNINAAGRYLGGYVGDIDASGKRTLTPEKAAACRLYVERKKNQKPKSPNNPNNTGKQEEPLNIDDR